VPMMMTFSSVVSLMDLSLMECFFRSRFGPIQRRTSNVER
jgi:hypothetical protein